MSSCWANGDAVTAFRAAVVDRPGQTVRVTDVTSRDLLPDEVLVAASAAGICHTDIAWSQGDMGPGYAFPVILGHEVVGRVEAVGALVRSVAVGDRVVASLSQHCGSCVPCERGTPVLCESRVERGGRIESAEGPVAQGFGIGGFAQKLVLHERAVVRVDSILDDDQVAVVGCALATGCGAVWNTAQLVAGSRCLVIGAGGVGLSAVIAARISGARQIWVVDPDERRRHQALAAGATHACASTDDVAVGGFDDVFEAAGHLDAMNAAIELTAPGGTTVLLGVPRHDARFEVRALEFVKSQKRIMSSLTGNLRPHVDLPRILAYAEAGTIDLGAFVGERLPLEHVHDAFRLAEERRGVRTILTLEGS